MCAICQKTQTSLFTLILMAVNKGCVQTFARETTYYKASAFIGTDLEEQLKRKQYDTFVTVGLTKDHCVSMTTRIAANLGFHPCVVSDATATFDRVATTENIIRR